VDGAHDADGIGQIRVNGKLTTARRIAWELAHGPLPPNRRLSGCPDEPRCVRVEHLALSGSAGRTTPRRAPLGGGSKREIRPGVWKLTVSAGRNESSNHQRVSRTIHGTEAQANRALRRCGSLLSAWTGPALGTVAPTDVTPGDVDELLARMHAEGQSPSSTHQARALLRSAYRWARTTYSIRHNPARADRP
jgi:hypothetical protein